MSDPRRKPANEPPWPAKGSVWREQKVVSLSASPDGPYRSQGSVYTHMLDEETFKIEVWDADWNLRYSQRHQIEDPAQAVERAHWIAEGALNGSPIVTRSSN